MGHSCVMPPEDVMWQIARGDFAVLSICCEWANWGAATMGKDHIYKAGGKITVESIVDLCMACMKVLAYE